MKQQQETELIAKVGNLGSLAMLYMQGQDFAFTLVLLMLQNERGCPFCPCSDHSKVPAKNQESSRAHLRSFFILTENLETILIS